jgi:hypothetical protein
MWNKRGFRIVITITALLTAVFCGKSEAAIVEVGNCIPSVPSYSTIQQAVNNAVAGDTVDVCPGVYPEQVTIQKRLTIAGIANSDGSYPTIEYPNTSDLRCVSIPGAFEGQPFCPQIFNELSTANVINLRVNGSGYKGGCARVPVGVLYYDGGGSVSNVDLFDQQITCAAGPIPFLGEGITALYVAPGSYGFHAVSDHITDFGQVGIEVEDLGAAVTIIGAVSENKISNPLAQSPEDGTAIAVASGTSPSSFAITGNQILNSAFAENYVGILAVGSAKIQNNVVSNGGVGINVVTNNLTDVGQNTITDEVIGIKLRCMSANGVINGNSITGNANSQAGILLNTCSPANGSNFNTIANNIISTSCAGILTGLTSNTGNVFVSNNFSNISPGSDIESGLTCP